MRLSNLTYLAIPALAMASPPVHNLDPVHQRRAVEAAIEASAAVAAPASAPVLIESLSTPTSTLTLEATKAPQEEEEQGDDILE